MNKNKIDSFLKEVAEENAMKRFSAIGAMFARPGHKAAAFLLSNFVRLETATDQILVSAGRDLALSIISEVFNSENKNALTKESYTLKDPAVFDIPTATFAVLVVHSALGYAGGSYLVFVTLKAVSETSTHVLLEGYARGLGNKLAAYVVKRTREQISACFH
ncbi:hypothetical protein ACQR16_16370 [Bradyrhizobium oligotrophicum]|uniref:hypothetical protein n=1 Tax=Bradyrhizobium oligotrophicum TaxID=44255 RepID=UPI003EB8A489